MTKWHDGVRFRAVRPVKDPTGFHPGVKRETRILPAGSTYGPSRPAPLGSRWHGGNRPLPVDIQLDQDVSIEMRDGESIYVDIFRPPGAVDVPAIVAWSPYGKQGGYWSYARGNLGKMPPLDWVSGLQKFEGPDPAEWVAHGYAVVNPDPPGTFASEGLIRTWGEAEGRHVYDVVEWLAEQEWCNGRVGMAGNSWLSVSQYFAAAERPPHLAAIAPWNGFFDVYDFTGPGGIPAPQFAELLTDFQWGTRMEYLPTMRKRKPLKDEYWEAHDAKLENIEVPAYVAHSWQVGIHRWTPEVFRLISSEHKWLRLANTHEWYDQYAPEYVEDLRKFFDRYLKGLDNGWEDTPRVRVSVLDSVLQPTESANPQHADSKGYEPAAEVDRPEHEWPLARTEYVRLDLAPKGRLADSGKVPADSETYRALWGSKSYHHTFTEDTELTGYATARLWIEVAGRDDADIYVDLCRLDRRGRRIALLETASLRVSHREIDEERSTDFVTYHTHREEQRLSPGERVETVISFPPKSMRFRAGDQLRLRVAGTQVRWKRDLSGGIFGGILGTLLASIPSRNRGARHIVHLGGSHASSITLPIVPKR